jgi:hypothetical protein
VHLPISIRLALELLARLLELKQEGSHPVRIVTRDRDFSIRDHDNRIQCRSWDSPNSEGCWIGSRALRWNVKSEIVDAVEDDVRRKLTLLVGPSQ